MKRTVIDVSRLRRKDSTEMFGWVFDAVFYDSFGHWPVLSLFVLQLVQNAVAEGSGSRCRRHSTAMAFREERPIVVKVHILAGRIGWIGPKVEKSFCIHAISKESFGPPPPATSPQCRRFKYIYWVDFEQIWGRVRPKQCLNKIEVDWCQIESNWFHSNSFKSYSN